MRRGHLSAAALVSLLLVPIIPAAAIAQNRALQSEAVQGTRIVRFAYTAFENPRVVSSDSGLHSLVRYLQSVSAQSRGPAWQQPIAFDISVGNYYQVWSWFRSKQVDAALVSPFIAHLLEREGDALSVLEFREHCDATGHQPLIAASGTWKDAAIVGFDHYLKELYDIARDSSSATDERQRMERLLGHTRLNFVAHLSSSGFVMPALYAHEWLQAHADRPSHSQQVDLETPAVANFWRLFIEHARFSLQHGVQAPENGISDLYFSYSGRPRDSLATDRARGQFAKWQGYHLDYKAPGPPGTECDREAHDPPEIPNDVLVVRRNLIAEIFGSGRIDRALLGDQLIPDPAQGNAAAALFASNTGYTGVSWFSNSAHELFRQRVESLFNANATLRRISERWFERGRFDFTIDETIGLLRQDQLNSRTSSLALVLSGGGVKSLYQTKLLDHLYGLNAGTRPMMRNYDADAVVALPIVDEVPLSVRNVIGTSGGAMLAYFAAQLPIPEGQQSLADRLLETTSRRLFPPADIPRVASIVVLLALLLATLRVARMLNRNTLRQAARRSVFKECPWGIYAVEAVLILGGALLVVAARHPNQETARGLEGFLYAFLVGLAHFSVSCLSGKSREQARSGFETPLYKGALAGSGLGAMMIVAGLALSLLILADDPMRESRIASVPPLLAIGGLCVTSMALITYAISGVGRLSLAVAATGRYFRAISIAGLVVALSSLVVAVASWFGAISALELTGPFWRWLVAAGLLVPTSVVLVALHSKGAVGKYLLGGTIELMRDRRRTTTTTLAGSLASFAGGGLLCWTVIVAPAIYGNEYARLALREALPSKILDWGAFKSNLIVTGALLADSPCPSLGAKIPRGGLYFCFGGSAGCREASHKSWQVVQSPPPRRALDAVFASGSPFPVFSPHSTYLPNGCRVPLVDGGYAHNVPLEAASLTDARQVLVINASPDLDDVEALPVDVSQSGRRWSGQLVRFGSRILDFMFSRAQELDRSIGSNLFVATLTPRPAEGIWPFLLDFTPGTRRRMIDEARNDIAQGRRIGRVENWGFPVFASHVTPDDRQLQPRGWSPEIRRTLDALIASASMDTTIALDLDNTILHGDIGDAMFLKMVVELRYRGDDDRFWKLIPNQRAAQVLRTYWTRFRDGRLNARYHEPHTWTPEFTDYVVLFLRQYEEMLRPADGGRVAYPWVVRLMGGLGAEAVRKMADDLWKTEMSRAAAPFTIHSRTYGDYEIQGGLRVHSEMKELIDDLQAKRAKVWIVTASSEWLGQHVAGLLKLPRERVLGIRLQTPDSYEVASPVTYREGKVQALRRSGNSRVALAIGDSRTDIEMLEAAETAIVIDRGRIAPTEVKKARRQPFNLLRSQALR